MKHSVPLKGGQDWASGKTAFRDGKITLSEGDTTGSRILARDKLVGVLYCYLLGNYGNCNVNLLCGYKTEDCTIAPAAAATAASVRSTAGRTTA